MFGTAVRNTKPHENYKRAINAVIDIGIFILQAILMVEAVQNIANIIFDSLFSGKNDQTNLKKMVW